jgi:hypothetical protein
MTQAELWTIIPFFVSCITSDQVLSEAAITVTNIVLNLFKVVLHLNQGSEARAMTLASFLTDLIPSYFVSCVV